MAGLAFVRCVCKGGDACLTCGVSMVQDLDSLDVNVNSWTSNPWPIKHQRIAYMQSRGPGCFDHRYYLQKNPDLKVLKTVLELWEHFVMLGQFEGRSYR